MNRAAHAFTSVERRIDRDAEAQRKREQRELTAAIARTSASALLGGFNEQRRPDVCEAAIRELCSRLKAMRDGPAVAALLGAISNDLNSDIKGGKVSARDAAEAHFSKGSSE